jgi:hypothetical protein
MSIKYFERSLMVQVKMFTAESESLDLDLCKKLVNQPGGEKYDHSIIDSQSYLEDLIQL